MGRRPTRRELLDHLYTVSDQFAALPKNTDATIDDDAWERDSFRAGRRRGLLAAQTIVAVHTDRLGRIRRADVQQALLARLRDNYEQQYQQQQGVEQTMRSVETVKDALRISRADALGERDSLRAVGVALDGNLDRVSALSDLDHPERAREAMPRRDRERGHGYD